MEKSFEIDFDEWELLPDSRHTFIDFSLKSEKGLFSTDIDIDYFSDDKNSRLMEEKEACKDIVMVAPSLQIPMVVIDHCDKAPKALFKKFKDDESVGMKIESPSKNAKNPIMPPVEPEQMMFDCKEEEEKFYKDEKNPEKGIDYVEPESKEQQFGIKILRWRLVGGVGALCSVGVAAATLCIFILGGCQLQKHQNRNQKIQFQIYTDEKRIKEVVQQATRLNQAFTAVRGVPMTRAHISFGGYYDGL